MRSLSLTTLHLKPALVVCHRRPLLAISRRSFFIGSPFSSSSSPSDQPPKSEQPTEPSEKQAQPSQQTAQNDEQAKKMEKLEQDLKLLKDQYLRQLADAENLRNRTRREKELAQQLAIKSFAKDLLSVADILELALQSVPEDKRSGEHVEPVLKGLYEGLQMTNNEIQKTFKRHGLDQFVPEKGSPFDPNECQAMFQAPVPDVQPGSVFVCQKSGYKLNGIVLRAAQVGIVQDQ